jgi:branched-chain amino acid transport system substrate-binding protein
LLKRNKLGTISLATAIPREIARMKYFLFICSLFLSASAFAETVKVVVALRFAPERNSNAADLYQGIELAAQEFNARQEESTRIELVKVSHKEGHDSVSAAGRKIVADKIQYVLGAEMSDDAFALAEEFQDKNILLLSATASNPLLTAGRPFVFRTCFTDDQVAQLLAKYVASLKNIKSIGVLHNTSNAYSDYVTNAFLDALEKTHAGKGAPAVTEFRYATESPQFDSAVQQFKQKGVDFVVAFTLQESIKSFEALAQKAAFTPQYLGSDGWGPSESLMKIPGFHGIRNDYWRETGGTATVTRFKKQFQKNYDHAPNSSNAAAYDSAVVLFEAIARAKKKTDVEEVANFIRNGTFSNVVTAQNIRFARNNSPKKPLYLYEIKDGKAQFLKAVE